MASGNENHFPVADIIMKTSSPRLLGNGMALVLLTTITSGCATSALWKSTARREWEPNPPDQVVFNSNTNQQREVAVLRQFARVGATTECRKVGWHVNQSPEQLALTP